MATPASAVQAVIAAALPSEDVRTGFEQMDADRGVWVALDGGLSPLQIAGVAETVKQPRVRVFVRVEENNHDALEALVASVLASVNRTAPAGYAVSNPQPVIELKPDEYGRASAVFRVQLTIVE